MHLSPSCANCAAPATKTCAVIETRIRAFSILIESPATDVLILLRPQGGEGGARGLPRVTDGDFPT